jgi:hypothetical protein
VQIFKENYFSFFASSTAAMSSASKLVCSAACIICFNVEHFMRFLSDVGKYPLEVAARRGYVEDLEKLVNFVKLHT